MPEIKTLVVISPGFPADEADTTCLPAQQQLVQNMQEQNPGLKIIVLSLHYPYVQSTYNWKNVTVVSFNGRNKGKFQRLQLWFKVWRKLKDIRKMHGRIGLFSFWCTECALIGSRFARKYKLQHFTWILGQDAKKDNKFVKLIKPGSHELVALSDFIADTFEQNHGIRPGHIISAGIDERWFPQQQFRRDIDVLGVGSLIELKRYDLFIEVVAATDAGLNAVICGKGPEENNLREQINRSGLQHTVTLAGELPYAEVLQMMKRARVFLHTSKYEGFGMVCLEALYAGAHVISFTNPMKRHIPHWHIVKTKEEMIAKLEELDSNPYLDHSAVLPFTMRDTAEEVMGLFY